MKILDLEKAQKAIDANVTPRMLRLGKLRRYVSGDQYDGRKKWTDKSVPVWDREPCVIWMAADGAITSNEDLLLADGRYPSISSRPEEDESEEGEALDEESSKRLDNLIRNIEREARLRAHVRQAYRDAQSVGTCIGLFGARQGRLFAESIQAEYAEAKLDALGNVLELVIQYPYLDVYRDSAGSWRGRAMLFRRVIDETADTTFFPAEANDTGAPPKWRVDPSKTVAHGLGFCPVLYHRFRLVASVVNDTDGHAVHAATLDEQDAFNVEASIRHEGAMHSLPQKYEIGVEIGFNPTGEVDASILAYGSKTGGGTFSPHSPPAEVYRSATPVPQGARKAGPGNVWQYSDPNVKVGQLELNPGALEALATTMADLRARICESLAWVPLNPEEIKFAAALSGKALERLMARQINRVAKDRDGFGIDYLRASYAMLLRVASKLGPTALKTRGLQKAHKDLLTFGSDVDWSDPPLSLRWGAWFAPVPEDEEKSVNTTAKAKESGFITKRTAVEKVSRIFNIENIDTYLESLEEEEAERLKRESEELARGIANAHKGLNGASGQRTGAGKPGTNPQNGSGGANAASPASKANDNR